MKISDFFLSTKNIDRILICFFVGLLIWPLLVNAWFVTGDGACHVYNAKVLVNTLLGIDKDFYMEYYQLNLKWMPNIFDHFVLGALQLIFSPGLAERIFVMLYLICFVFGAYFLCTQVDQKNGWIAILAMLFAYHHLLVKGFYNFSFSIATSFWVIGYFIRLLNKGFNRTHLMYFGGLILTTYFIHPIGFIMGIIACVFIFAFKILEQTVTVDASKHLSVYFKKNLPILLMFIPALILYQVFFSSADFAKPFNWGGLWLIDSLMVYDDKERDFSKVISAVVLIFGLIAVIYRIIKIKKIHFDGDGLFVLAITLSLFYLLNLINDGMMGNARLQFLPHLCLILWLSTFTYRTFAKYTLISLAGVTLIFLSSIRYPKISQASTWVDDYMECADKINARTKLLTLNYDFNGTNPDGSLISDINWPFVHATSYLGGLKPLILSDNYQAHMFWFPILWRDQKYSFYNSASVDGKSFEERPPFANIIDYGLNSGKGAIDYVLVIGKKPEHLSLPQTEHIDNQLQTHYEKICESKSKRSVLFRVKGNAVPQ